MWRSLMDVAKLDFNDINRLGNLIRTHRIKNNMTQKSLAEKCGLNESTIRNYELGNRRPDEKTLLKIANALEISYYTLADPNPFNSLGALHILFILEWQYGLVPKMIDGNVCLTFEERSQYSAPANKIDIQNMKTLIHDWNLIRNLWKEDKITALDYVNWEDKYPLQLSPTLSAEMGYTDTLLEPYTEDDHAFSHYLYIKEIEERMINGIEDTPEEKLLDAIIPESKELKEQIRARLIKEGKLSE